MFRMLPPDQVRVVFVGQSPYPGYCPVSKVPYAYGPAFFPSPGCVTTPATLRNIIQEASRDLSKPVTRSPSETLLDWIDQGVMLLNASLTLGVDCPAYLEDHSVLWEEPMHEILTAIAEKLDPIFVLVGKDAWKFESSISASCCIKVSHPVARKETSTPWSGSCVFSRVSLAMIEKGMVPIRWLS